MQNTFYERLRSAVRLHRRKSGLSQQELAKHAGVGKTVIFDIEHGKKSIQLDTLLKVLEILNIQIQLVSPFLDQVSEDHERS